MEGGLPNRRRLQSRRVVFDPDHPASRQERGTRRQRQRSGDGPRPRDGARVVARRRPQSREPAFACRVLTARVRRRHLRPGRLPPTRRPARRGTREHRRVTSTVVVAQRPGHPQPRHRRQVLLHRQRQRHRALPRRQDRARGLGARATEARQLQFVAGLGGRQDLRKESPRC
jgi:hypothetical protein